MKATKTLKKTNTETSLGRVLLRLDSTSDAPVKLIFLILYILGAVLIWNTQAEIAASTEKIEYISPIAEFAARNIFVTYIFACDELAEMLDKTGLSKEQKETVNKIEGLLSTIARQGRAFGIHLILATQRPDSTILNGQIKNNINCRICGRADNVLSMIILDNTNAADLIPEDAQGRFLLKGGSMFQAYRFDDAAGIAGPHP